MKIRPTVTKKRSVKNMSLYKKVKSRTWGPQKKSKPVDTAQQDTEQESAPETHAGLLALPYDLTSDGGSSVLTEPHILHRTAAAGPDIALMESEPGSVPQSPSTTAIPKPPLPISTRVKSVKKMTSFLRLKKARAEPPSASPSPLSPPASQRIQELELEPNLYNSPPTTTSSTPPQHQTLPDSSTCSTSHLQLSTPASPAPSTPTTDLTPHPEDPLTPYPTHELRALKPASTASTHNALRLALEAHDISTPTLAHLHAQDARLTPTEPRLLGPSVQTLVAGERIRTLKRARTFAHVANPFLAGARGRAGGGDGSWERGAREAVRRGRWEEALRRRVTVCFVGGGGRVVERGKYQFEADSEEEAFEEEEVEGGMERLGEGVLVAREVGVRMGEVVDEGDVRLGRVREMVDLGDDGVEGGRRALGSIR